MQHSYKMIQQCFVTWESGLRAEPAETLEGSDLSFHGRETSFLCSSSSLGLFLESGPASCSFLEKRKGRAPDSGRAVG